MVVGSEDRKSRRSTVVLSGAVRPLGKGWLSHYRPSTTFAFQRFCHQFNHFSALPIASISSWPEKGCFWRSTRHFRATHECFQQSNAITKLQLPFGLRDQRDNKRSSNSDAMTSRIANTQHARADHVRGQLAPFIVKVCVETHSDHSEERTTHVVESRSSLRRDKNNPISQSRFENTQCLNRQPNSFQLNILEPDHHARKTL